MQNKKYFCYEIYKNLAIWSHNGQLSYNPCSFFNGYIKTTDTYNHNEIWNSQEHQHLKNLVEQDKPIDGCRPCYYAEEHGLPSRRQGSKQFYEIFIQDTQLDLLAPQSIDYSVGSLCNLKCVICGPQNSTAWASDYQKLNPHVSLDLIKYEKSNQTELTDPDLLSNLKNIHFHGGGEPLLSKNHVNLLKRVKQLKGLSDLHIHYNTNGTKIVDSEILELWAECNLVELYFSIDDVGERFNYQRTGADWEQVNKNLQWFYENMPSNHMFKVNCTWSYLNIYYLNELVDWWKNKFQYNRLGDPTSLIFQKAIGECEVKYLSAPTKQKLIDKFSDYSELLAIVEPISESDNSHCKFLTFINNLDKIRNTK